MRGTTFTSALSADHLRLTDVSKRLSTEQRDAGDEDGPPSDADEEQRAEVTDSDAVSEAEGGGGTGPRSAHMTREPLVAWRR